MSKKHITEALFNARTLLNEPADFRIGAIVVDGMWWTFEQIQDEAKVTDKELQTWIDEQLKLGNLVQAHYGAKSYRMPLTAIEQWHKDNHIPLGSQIVSFLFAPRIWDNMTEVEGFELAPLREIATVSFACPQNTAKLVEERLRGVARVREMTPGHYRAHGLSSEYIVKIIKEVYTSLPDSERGTAHPRSYAKRRETVDFSREFLDSLVEFYKKFSHTLLSAQMDTIKIFLPDPYDRDAQIVDWVLSAVEKYDEKSSVPFSGYLNKVLKHWPFDLPNVFLGKELSNFQRKRSKAIKALSKRNKDVSLFSTQDVAKEMEIDHDEFNRLEDEHRAWISVKNATTLNWDEGTSEERSSIRIGESNPIGDTTRQARETSKKMSLSILDAGLNSKNFVDALRIIENIDSDVIDMNAIGKIPDSFKEQFLHALHNNGVRI